MKTLTRNEAVAVFAGLAVLTYLLFSSQLMNLFNIHMDNNGLTANTSDDNTQVPQSGFRAQDTVAGQGELAEPGDLVTVHYVGQLTSGRVFDSSRDVGTPFQFVLGSGRVIKGWDEGVQGMRVGGKRVLVIAPDYAYGDQAIGAIPANSILVFEVELLNVEKSQ